MATDMLIGILSNHTDVNALCSNDSDIMNCTLDINETSRHGIRNLSQQLGAPLHPQLVLAYNIFLYIMIALGVPGNLLVLIVFFKHPPSTTTDWFILFITSFDFISSVINVPIYVTFTNGVWRTYGTSTICKLQMFFSQSFVLSSSFLICGLALDRYFKVCRPNSSTITKSRSRNYCILISILTFILSTPCFSLFGNVNGRCINTSRGYTLLMYYLMVFLSFLIATAAVIVSYVMVSRTILKSESTMSNHEKSHVSGVKLRSRSFWWCCKNSYLSNRVGPIASSRDSSYRQDVVVKDGDSNGKSSDDNGRSCCRNNTLELSVSLNHWVAERPVPSNASNISMDPSKSGNSSTRLANNTQNMSSNSRSLSRKTVSLRTTKISFLVCSVFVITWLPPWVSFLLVFFPKLMRNVTVLEFMMFGKMTYLLNTVANPILYTWLNRKFRQHAKDIITCRSCKGNGPSNLF